MLKSQNIVCIANTTWFGKYAKSTVQIMERLAKDNNVLFVEYPFTIKDVYATIKGTQQSQIMRMFGIRNRIEKIKTNSGSEVYDLVVPPVLPLFFLKNEKLFRFLFQLNVLIYKSSLKRALSKLNFQNPIFITAYNPIYGLSLLRKMNELAHIYYCYDGVEAGFYGKRIFEIEDNFAKNVDGIITTSDYLNAQKSVFNKNCFVVKNGVDFPHFSKFAKTQVFKRERKRVGFIGSLDPRFDIETVEYAISNMPDYDFEFIGDMRNELMKSTLSKFPHVKFFEPVQPDEVPALLAQYDAGMIPYLVNDVNKNIYPLKINEFMAVGVPLVMTPFATLPEFENMVSVSESKHDFVIKLKTVMNEDTADKIMERVQFASKNSWDARTLDFANFIQQIISDRHS